MLFPLTHEELLYTLQRSQHAQYGNLKEPKTFVRGGNGSRTAQLELGPATIMFAGYVLSKVIYAVEMQDNTYNMKKSLLGDYNSNTMKFMNCRQI